MVKHGSTVSGEDPFDPSKHRLTKAPGLVYLTGEPVSPDAKSEDILRKFFGHKEFRFDQAAPVNAAIAGKDVFLVMATSAGKSITFQVPAILHYVKREGSTIVVSPLISLIRDQVDKLNQRNIPVASFDSLQSSADRREALERVRDGVPLIYVSPEKFVSQSFQKFLRGESRQSEGVVTKVARVVIDEAHLVSQWGHDFRPGYGDKLGRALDAMGRPPLFVCTATAPEPVRQDVKRILGFSKEHLDKVSELDRPNLTYSVRRFDNDKEKLRELIRDLHIAKRQGYGDDPVIIYCYSRKSTEDIAKALNDSGIKRCSFYHAGMRSGDRIQVQKDFMEGNTPIVVATNAFGLGIDKSNVKRVIHFHTPGSLEAYYQESGRAGRDGKPASCELWHANLDVDRQMKFIVSSNPSREFIKKVYDQLWKILSPEEKRKECPVLRGFRQTYLGESRDRDDPKGQQFDFLRGPRRAALTALIEHGIINEEGDDFEILVKPRSVFEKLPSEEWLATKKARAVQGLLTMCYYASIGKTGGDETLRSVIMDHFMHNTIAEKVQDSEIKEILGTERTRLMTIVDAVNRADRNVTELSKVLRGTKAGRGEENRDFEGAFDDLNPTEVKLLMKRASFLGLIRMHRRGKESTVALAEQGRVTLKSDPGYSSKDLLEPSTAYAKLERRLGHISEKPTLMVALFPWRDKLDRARTVAEYDQILNDTRNDRFEVLGVKKSVLELTAVFCKCDPEKVTNRDLRHFSTYLFRDRLTLLADRKALRSSR